MLRESLYWRGAWWWRCYACGDRVDGVIFRNRAEDAVARLEHREWQEREMLEWAQWMGRLPL